MPAAEAVIRARAAETGAAVTAFGADWRAEIAASRFDFEDRHGRLRLPRPALPGDHQCLNAGLAIATLHAQTRFRVSPEAIAAGLGAVSWPARLQEITAAVPRLAAGVNIWLDGGHNPAAGETLNAAFATPARPLYIISGMLANKDAAGFLNPFQGRGVKLFAIDISGEDCHPAASLAAIAQNLGIEATAAAGFEAALGEVKTRISNGPPADILIAGSLYLAGQVLSRFGLLPA